MSITIQNPILTGMHPDPSIVRVGKDFYLVTSTFEYYPGIPVYHSTDLLHWEQIGHVLSRPDQLVLPKGAPNCIGIYAPTIRYDDGIFYCVCTNVGDGEHGPGNFFCTTTDPYGEWSDPIWLDLEGIDPSLYFEDDHMYYTGTDTSIYICEIDRNSGARIGEKHYIWGGSGGNNPEGPHLYKLLDTYYLMIAEGGTESGHMVTIARSSSLLGPYESCPYNPVLTNRGMSNPIMGVGHADLVCDPNGYWWAVCLCFRPLGYPFTYNLGRETCLVPVTWKDGWPQMGDGTRVYEEMEIDRIPLPNLLDGSRYVPCSDVIDECKANSYHPSWNTVYCAQEGLYEATQDGIFLHGNHVHVWEDDYKAMLVRRQEHFEFRAEAQLSGIPLKDGDEYGIGVYMNPRHRYEIVVGLQNGERSVFLRRQLGSLGAVEAVTPFENDAVTLGIYADRNEYHLGYYDGDHNFIELGTGECRKLTTECGGCFTGNYLHVFASGMDVRMTRYQYQGNTIHSEERKSIWSTAEKQ